MAKLNLKTVNKKTKDQLITFVLVIAVYIVVQIMVAAGAISSLMQGLLVPMCTYSIVAFQRGVDFYSHDSCSFFRRVLYSITHLIV